jgi:hypothetical protein
MLMKYLLFILILSLRISAVADAQIGKQFPSLKINRKKMFFIPATLTRMIACCVALFRVLPAVQHLYLATAQRERFLQFAAPLRRREKINSK